MLFENWKEWCIPVTWLVWEQKAEEKILWKE